MPACHSLFPGPSPEDTELTGWSTSDPDTEKTQVSQNLRATLSWPNMSPVQLPRVALLVIQSPFRLQLCLHKEEVASPELQGCKGSETRVQLLAFCVQLCKIILGATLKYLVLDLIMGLRGTWGSAEMVSYSWALWSACHVSTTWM